MSLYSAYIQENKATVYLHELGPNKRNYSIRIVNWALNREYPRSRLRIDERFSRSTRRYYSRWQRSLGYSRRDADGFPARDSLIKLGNKYGFRVR